MYREFTRDSAPDTVSWRWALIHSQYTGPFTELAQLSKSKSGRVCDGARVGHESAPFTLALVVLFTALTDVSTLHMP